jgi:acyl-CoA synthetase (AMP-forming)/AMP-acid ligase II
MAEASGIDRASSVEDVQAAFRQLGAELRMDAAGDGWEARVVTQGDEQLLETGSTVDSAELLAFAREQLTAYKVPRRVVVLDSLPRSLIGKVLRREIRDNLVGRA